MKIKLTSIFTLLISASLCFSLIGCSSESEEDVYQTEINNFQNERINNQKSDKYSDQLYIGSFRLSSVNENQSEEFYKNEIIIYSSGDIDLEENENIYIGIWNPDENYQNKFSAIINYTNEDDSWNLNKFEYEYDKKSDSILLKQEDGSVLTYTRFDSKEKLEDYIPNVSSNIVKEEEND